MSTTPQGICIVTPLAPLQSPWTAAAPLPVTATRIAALAAATLRGVERLLMHGTGARSHAESGQGKAWRALLVPSLKTYDAVLVLTPSALAVAPGKVAVEDRDGSRVLEEAGVLGTVRVGAVMHGCVHDRHTQSSCAVCMLHHMDVVWCHCVPLRA